MRTTKREVEAVFERLCNTAGVVPFIGTSGRYWTADDGAMHHKAGWSLDHNPTYGGYVVRGHGGIGTGEFHPLSEYRMPAGEFVRAMHMAIRAMDHLKRR